MSFVRSIRPSFLFRSSRPVALPSLSIARIPVVSSINSTPIFAQSLKIQKRYFTQVKSQENAPENSWFLKSHEWATCSGDIATVGITNYAQQTLGDVVYCELPQVGTVLKREESFCTLENVKTAVDVYAPFSGEVVEVNSELVDQPELINENPYTTGWLIKLKVANVEEKNELMDIKKYEEFLEAECYNEPDEKSEK